VFAWVTISASDLEASRAFYDVVLATVGLERDGDRWGQLSVVQSTSPTTRLHVGFAVPTHEEVDAFWHAGTEAGYRDDGAPGPRPQYSARYYGAFLLDPDGNSVEAVFNTPDRRRGLVDHLWIRVADLAASRAFYEDAAPRTGFRQAWTGDDPPRVGFRGRDGSFSLVEDGPPTRNVAIAFPGGTSVELDPDGNELGLADPD
jgi:catechol 2,3-dioxygenase-like lactoylglutathione lyase family enzyme